MLKKTLPESGLLPIENYSPIKINRPVDSDQQAERYLFLLINLTTDQIRQRANAVIPPEAYDFIGPQRAAMNEKMKAVIELGSRIQEARYETTYHERLNQAIKDLVTFSSRPTVSMAVISRLWKYLDDLAKRPYDDKKPGLYPSRFDIYLKPFLRKKGQESLSYDEEKELCEAIKAWKQGVKPEDAIKTVDSAIMLARRDARFTTDRSREYAGNALINRKARDERVQHLLAIKKFLEELFKSAPPNS